MRTEPYDYEIVIDWESDSIKFGDYKPLPFWWEDMRRREMIELMKKVFNEGFLLGQQKQRKKDALYKEVE